MSKTFKFDNTVEATTIKASGSLYEEGNLLTSKYLYVVPDATATTSWVDSAAAAGMFYKTSSLPSKTNYLTYNGYLRATKVYQGFYDLGTNIYSTVKEDSTTSNSPIMLRNGTSSGMSTVFCDSDFYFNDGNLYIPNMTVSNYFSAIDSSGNDRVNMYARSGVDSAVVVYSDNYGTTTTPAYMAELKPDGLRFYPNEDMDSYNGESSLQHGILSLMYRDKAGATLTSQGTLTLSDYYGTGEISMDPSDGSIEVTNSTDKTQTLITPSNIYLSDQSVRNRTVTIDAQDGVTCSFNISYTRPNTVTESKLTFDLDSTTYSSSKFSKALLGSRGFSFYLYTKIKKVSSTGESASNLTTVYIVGTIPRQSTATASSTMHLPAIFIDDCHAIHPSYMPSSGSLNFELVYIPSGLSTWVVPKFDTTETNSKLTLLF